jgi:muconolactone delta-isomerase
MVTMRCPEILTEEFVGLIPEQRAKVVEFMARGILTSYSLAHDRSILWGTFVANSEADVRDILRRFPLTNYMESIDVRPLMFHNVMNFAMPQFSLN